MYKTYIMSSRNIGRIISVYRIEKNKSREQMADLLGISLKTYERTELGKRLPTLKELQIISDALDIDHSLFFKDGETMLIAKVSKPQGVGVLNGDMNGDVNLTDQDLVKAVSQLAASVAALVEAFRDREV